MMLYEYGEDKISGFNVVNGPEQDLPAIKE
jgi:hypothetical protein